MERVNVTARLSGPTLWATGLLLASIVVSACVVFLRSEHPRTLGGVLAFAFPTAILAHPSARSDFLFWISRKLVMLPLALPASAAVAAAIGYATNAGLRALLGPVGVPKGDPSTWQLVLFTASMLLVYDLSYYLYHTLQHRIPILWELHKVHHSAEVMVGTTKDRIHPLDEAMNKLWDGLLTGPLYGLWLFWVFDPVELTVLGINIYVLRNIIMMDFVRHTHLKISFGPVINAVLLCPHYHQLHHSTDERHFDRNFGLMLSVWDRMFGTLAVPEPNESFSFGLTGNEAADYQSLRGLYLLPLWRMARHLPLRRWLSMPSPSQSPTRSEVRLRAEVVTTPSRLDTVAAPWERLWQRAGQSLFQRHGWIRAWWMAQEWSDGPQLHVGLVWDGDELAAVIPCVIQRHRGMRVLEWAAKECSDYCDALAAPPDRAALELGWRAMAQAGGYHLTYLSHVRPGAAIRLLAGKAKGDRVALRLSQRRETTLQVRSRGLTGAEWFRTLPKKARNNHTRGKRIISEMGALSIKVSDGSNDAAKLDRMIELKRDWLTATGKQSSVLEHDGRTLRSQIAYLQSCGALQLFSIECDDALAAGLVSIVHNNHVAPLFSAFDPRFERSSPGNLVIVEQLMWAFDRHLPEVDFLCGDEPYKFLYADAQTDLAAFVGARTLVGHAALMAGQWLDRAPRRAAAGKIERAGGFGLAGRGHNNRYTLARP